MDNSFHRISPSFHWYRNEGLHFPPDADHGIIRPALNINPRIVAPFDEGHDEHSAKFRRLWEV
jgi:hypothetical protein